MSEQQSPGMACPIPFEPTDKVLLSHGGGGRHMHELLARIFFRHFDNRWTTEHNDAALLDWEGGPLAMTTDSFVIDPLFFPGGDIGSLAIHGTVNDLAVSGAEPRYLSAAFILEEGFPLAELDRIVASMRRAADAAGVLIVTGDTKVVERGKGDGVFINTTGFGVPYGDPSPSPSRIEPGDRILVSGDIGRHGIAVMAARQGLSFETPLESDSAQVWPSIRALLDAGIEIKCMRDLTRGGLGAALSELAGTAGVDFTIDENEVPVGKPVAAACEILGIDPLFVANEGRFTAVVPAEAAETAVAVLKREHEESGIIGEVLAGKGRVHLRRPPGITRYLLVPAGDQLPRIC